MGLGAIGLIGTVASTGLQLYSQHQQAKSAEAAAQYNNTLAEREATNTELQTAEGIKRQRINDRAALAELKVRLSASGSQSTTGSPLSLIGDVAGRQEITIADAARNASMQAASLRAKGKMGLWEADQVASASKLQMFGTALQGATSAFGMYQQGSYQGVNYRIGGN